MSRRPAASSPPARPAHEMDPIERTVHRILGVGIAVAVTLLLLGLALSAAKGEGLPSHVVGLSGLPGLLAHGDPAAYLSLGLLALIATPFVRVAGTIVAFACERDRRYVVITAVVLAVMCVSVVLGKA